MDEETLHNALSQLPVGAVKYYPTIGSTNQAALDWAMEGAPEYALVIADHQSAGRGRSGRVWVTRPGVALALSLIIHPTPQEAPKLQLFSPLGALALCLTLEKDLGITGVEIKWPNDVLIQRKKVAGILAESNWDGDQPHSTVIGIGVNLLSDALPTREELFFPATYIQAHCKKPFQSETILARIVHNLIAWRAKVSTPEFLKAWEDRLAFQNETIFVHTTDQEKITGTQLGVTPNGDLRLKKNDGSEIQFHFGDVHLRPF